MRARPSSDTPETRRRADVLLRLLTRSAVLGATGATIAIGVVVAKEHPGAERVLQPGPCAGSDYLDPEHFAPDDFATHHDANLIGPG